MYIKQDFQLPPAGPCSLKFPVYAPDAASSLLTARVCACMPLQHFQACMFCPMQLPPSRMGARGSVAQPRPQSTMHRVSCVALSQHASDICKAGCSTVCQAPACRQSAGHVVPRGTAALAAGMPRSHDPLMKHAAVPRCSAPRVCWTLRLLLAALQAGRLQLQARRVESCAQMRHTSACVSVRP